MTARAPGAGRGEPPAELRAAQRLLRALVTAPAGVAATLDRAEDAPGWLDAFEDARAELARTVQGDAKLGATGRLGVYGDAYFARLREVLEDDFPTVAGIVGEEAFSDLVSAYLAAHPSTSPTLRDLGAAFAGFVAGHPVAAFARSGWPGVADVARLEWAFAEVFDAVDAPALTGDALATVAPERWSDIPLAPVPAFVLLSFDWPVSELVRARRRGEPAPPRRDAPEVVAVWRERERAVFRAVEPREAEALAHVVRRERFGDLCERLAGEGLADEAAAAEAAGRLAGWVRAAWLAALPVAFRESAAP